VLARGRTQQPPQLGHGPLPGLSTLDIGG
jgi:hypothetical protein